MKQKIIAIFLILALAATMVACEKKEETTTTLTGMVVSVDGTVIQLMEIGSMGGNGGSGRGQRPEGMEMPEGMTMPEGMEGFGNFTPENFNPENFDGSMPQWGGGQRPEGMPEDMTIPEGMTMPEGMEGFGGGRPGNFGGGEFSREDFASNMETKSIDIGSAHISLEEDGVKATGSLSDIKAGSMVTITMNSKGEVTNVLVTASSGFGGGNFGGGNFPGGRPGNFDNFGGNDSESY